MADGILPARQARSQQTVAAILDAAEELLREEGLAGFSMIRAAQRASRAVGTVYERFADRDALLGALFERYLARGADQNAEQLDALDASDADLRNVCHAIATGLVRRNRVDGKILQALRALAAGPGGDTIARQAVGVAAKALKRSREALLRRGAEIRHSNPEAAVDAVLLMLGGAAELNGTTAGSRMKDDDLAKRLCDAAVCYLTTASAA